MDLDTDQVVTDRMVTRYFGMYVDGAGTGAIRVRIGNRSAQKSYVFQLSTTRFTSFLFDDNLAEEVSRIFRRGVGGEISIDILDADGLVSDSASFTVNVKRSKKNCTKYPSPRLKRCEQAKLATVGGAARQRLATELASSIRGPIILEP